jgi:hypothetical protein
VEDYESVAKGYLPQILTYTKQRSDQNNTERDKLCVDLISDLTHRSTLSQHTCWSKIATEGVL